MLESVSHFELADEELAQGRIVEALRCLTEGLALEPHNAAGHSQLLVALHYLPIDGAKLAQEHERWARMHLPRRCEVIIHPNSREPERRLKLAYFAADFRHHRPYLDGVLKAHDQESFDLQGFVGATGAGIDLDIEWLSARFNRWCCLGRLTDQQVAQAVRDEQIDIVIDLDGHNPGHRLRALALKPAPVQVSYLGYPTPTAVPAIDYLLGDRFIDAASQSVARSEKLFALEPGYLCYAPGHHGSERAKPRASSRPFTFGVWSPAARIDTQAIRCWGAIVARATGSRLQLCCPAIGDQTRARLTAQLEQVGLSPDQFALPVIDAEHEEQRLAQMSGFDLMLDTFPCGGVTSVCEALWMGVPVISRRGHHRRANFAAGLLTRVGSGDCVADTDRGYVDLAVGHALSPQAGRTAFRAELRQRTREILGDHDAFTRGLEQALRTMWRTWCKGRA